MERVYSCNSEAGVRPGPLYWDAFQNGIVRSSVHPVSISKFRMKALPNVKYGENIPVVHETAHFRAERIVRKDLVRFMVFNGTNRLKGKTQRHIG